ncbi:hypothetical protein VIGAN_08036800 [Vigna angularis var. angularis]|uniref:Uncharacterized protein n=1 Tax=Vigna angularis var. angularis TaxID=157739 RepID=A0A0S3SM10_PHAAN|nr:hypothetical protein VIGAN_08036800 [Vigna angularis var. angularis]
MGMGGLGSKAYAMLLLNPSLTIAKQNMVFLPYTSHTAVFLYFFPFLLFLLLIHLRSLNFSHLVILSLFSLLYFLINFLSANFDLFSDIKRFISCKFRQN